ncbi:MAG: hypothetical protein PUB12_00525 [[Clostridium] aminophilum]|uniref:CpsB/CapC family capsule biosynthesis tyrosine phosphatase n=1 Tax=[Clostridium] aminophilum TaxID=1526 RepID=UPI0026EEA50C|nr:CpsB/CapC family capsule biosynthesis tyrosine phosphatase [[Clostridium] aminophilum]MDD6195380.1 hypothetical protein [[Clostridium] aminophilum]
MLKFYDIHTHVLPGMDDGCQTAEMSLAVLRSEFAQGAAGLVATPHYYPKEPIRTFLERRAAAGHRLFEAVSAKGLAEKYRGRIHLGAEVYYSRALASDPDLELLCVGRSRCMLLEMPFQQWTPRVLDDVEEIIRVRGLRVVIAHLERYVRLTDADSIRRLLDMDVIIQMNAGGFIESSARRRMLRYLREGVMQAIGSDTHNTDRRPPDIGQAADVICSAGLENELRSVFSMNERIFFGKV